jgi:hypothetical protein
VTDVLQFDAYRFATAMVWLGTFLVLVNLVAVVSERTIFALGKFRRRLLEHRYQPIAERAILGDPAARHRLVVSPRRHRFYVARLLVQPLYNRRDPERVAKVRAILDDMLLPADADRWLQSRLWWKRIAAVRAFGVLQMITRTPAIVAALDDENDDVRAAALDALADLRDPQSLQALIVRLHDESLPRGRRFAAVAAFGDAGETFLLEMSRMDTNNRADYARALRFCGTSLSLPALARWTQDPDATVREAAFEALGNIGLDDHTASLALQALEGEISSVRAMAAYALQDSRQSSEIAAQLARHLDDRWPVAVRAAQALKKMGHTGVAALQTAASRPDLAGELARQTLWEVSAGW